ncbi:MAG: flagellar biosynthesis anti-sigma factor FlgM [Sulfurospirillaceae bacterium]|jgi:anti-sigma28 factor (negative regulator of flagellin synthesis)|nr:flagellar biosynthesis anti-sigma factor FlgM [Sulfurospirillaceae bacterium]MDD2826226.1 flagellar biosynthesis anti-sigma factor FlgM [Sulfurospirillaceae bacterium]
MISNINAQSTAYIQSSAPKENESKGVNKTEKSEELDKVSSLKKQIQEGTYQVDLFKTAQSITEELL